LFEIQTPAALLRPALDLVQQPAPALSLPLERYLTGLVAVHCAEPQGFLPRRILRRTHLPKADEARPDQAPELW
jgi:hypothetical protein